MDLRPSWKRARATAMTMLACLAAHGGNAVAGECPKQTKEMSLDGQEPIFWNTLRGETISGDKQALFNAVAAGERIGVTWHNWQGQVYAECDLVEITPGKDVRCKVDAFCAEPIDGIPNAHGEIVSISSDGKTSTLVLQQRQEGGERSIIAVSTNTSPVAWYFASQLQDDGEAGQAEETPAEGGR